MDISILTIEESDIPKILEIQVENNLSKWKAEDYRDEISRESSIIITAKISDETVGFLMSRFIKFDVSISETVKYAEAELDILNFGVFRRFQKRGIGKLLFEHLLNQFTAVRLKTVWLEVRESNFDAIGFYKSRGFRAVQKRNDFYRQPSENAVVMKLER